MTTVYKFKAGYTKLGVATAPSAAPTITIVDSANNVLANAQATTALANMVGAYLYSYSGTDGLDLVGKFTTADLTMDASDLFSIPDVFSLMATSEALGTLQGNVTTILSDYARRTLDYSTLTAAQVWSYATRTITGGSIAVAEIWDALITSITTTGSVGKLIKDNLNATVSSRASLGAGSTSTPITIDDGTNPLDGVDVWATTDIAGTNVVARGYTNTAGLVTLMLDAGTYYIWKTLAGYSFTNPSTLVVT